MEARKRSRANIRLAPDAGDQGVSKDTAAAIAEVEAATAVTHQVVEENGDRLRIRHLPPQSALDEFIAWLIAFTVVHFMMYGPFLVVFWSLVNWFVTPVEWQWVGWLSLVAIVVGYQATIMAFPVQKRAKGNLWPAARGCWLWKYPQMYLRAEAVRTAKLDPQQRYIFAWHPHGILIFSRLAAYGSFFTSLFPGVDQRTLAASPLFNLFAARELSSWHGAVDAGRKTAYKLIRSHTEDGRPRSLMVYPGGSREIFTTNPNSTTTDILLEHHGFLRMAMSEGVPVVPVVVFGEKWLLHRATLPKAVSNFVLNTLKIPLVLIFGQCGTCMPLRPRRDRPLAVVYGEPIDLPRLEDPSPEELKEVVERYAAAVRALWEEWAPEFGYGDEEKLRLTLEKRSKKAKPQGAKGRKED